MFLGDAEYDLCPEADVDVEELYDAISMLRWAENGVLPELGGTNNQWNLDLELIGCAAQADSDHRKDQHG